MAVIDEDIHEVDYNNLIASDNDNENEFQSDESSCKALPSLAYQVHKSI